MQDADHSRALQEQVIQARAAHTPLSIHGLGSKAFYGRAATGLPLHVAEHAGVLSYDPSELVIRARAGTPLREIEALLDAHGQMLAFEPPRFGDGGTLGGAVACGLSGPRRPWAGAARDFVLGTRVLTGRGEILEFGGQVMKNVAGYDGFRLMCGALGTLGVLLDLSIKVLPKPAAELSLVQELPVATAIRTVNGWTAQALPLSGAAIADDRLHLRFEGSEATLRGIARRVGGETGTAAYWNDLRDHRLAFFSDAQRLWRLSLPPTAPVLDLPGRWLLDWGGAQRWYNGDADTATLHDRAVALGGHAVRFRGGDRQREVFQPLAPGLHELHRRLKQAFDPDAILNPGRLYGDL